MRRLSFIFVMLFHFLTLNNIMAWDTTAAKYMPLKIGNIWVYSGYSATLPCHGSNWFDKYILTGTTQINGKTYFLINHTLVYLTGDCCWSSILFYGDFPLRIDSANMNIYKKDNWCNVGESLVDSLMAGNLDTSWECSSPIGRKAVCSDTGTYFFCGISRPVKTFRIGSGWDYGEIQTYAKDIGLVSYFYYCGGTYQITLRGCVINGVVCADTSMPVGIRVIGSTVPNEYFLFQNYPNPFNPSTKIRFDIPLLDGDRAVKLVIFDILGREITTIVNEQLKPGTYEVNWDASNYPSGIYFYKLISGNYTESKKMILLR